MYARAKAEGNDFEFMYAEGEWGKLYPIGVPVDVLEKAMIDGRIRIKAK